MWTQNREFSLYIVIDLMYNEVILLDKYDKLKKYYNMPQK